MQYLTEVLATGSITRIVAAIMAVFFVWLMLKMLDRIGDTKFESAMIGMRTNAIASSIYFGLRFVGACLLVGLIIS